MSTERNTRAAALLSVRGTLAFYKARWMPFAVSLRDQVGNVQAWIQLLAWLAIPVIALALHFWSKWTWITCYTWPQWFLGTTSTVVVLFGLMRENASRILQLESDASDASQLRVDNMQLKRLIRRANENVFKMDKAVTMVRERLDDPLAQLRAIRLKNVGPLLRSVKALDMIEVTKLVGHHLNEWISTDQLAREFVHAEIVQGHGSSDFAQAQWVKALSDHGFIEYNDIPQSAYERENADGSMTLLSIEGIANRLQRQWSPAGRLFYQHVVNT